MIIGVCVYVCVHLEYLDVFKPFNGFTCYFKTCSHEHLTQLCYREVLPNIYGTTNSNIICTFPENHNRAFFPVHVSITLNQNK